MASSPLRMYRVVLFSSISQVSESLLRSSLPPCMQLEIVDDDALGGDGVTVGFDPSRLGRAARDALSRAEVLVSEPSVVSAVLRHDPYAFPSLRWCQSTYAGVDPFFDGDSDIVSSPPPWKLTRFAGIFGPPIAEWCLARIIGHERSFAATAGDQKRRQWAGSRGAVTKYRYLSSMTLSILGAGDIGRCIGRAAQSFGMRTVGYARTARRSGDGVDEYVTDLGAALRAGDYVVSVLPSTHGTKGMLSGGALAAASRENGGRRPVLINVGRGDVVDDASLLEALEKEYLSAAILDVFGTEPLPKTSPLWDRDDVVVSPHVSGVTRAEDVPEVFLENYRRYINGEELLYGVDWAKGY